MPHIPDSTSQRRDPEPIQVITGARHRLRLDVEHIAHAHGALDGNNPGKWVIRLGSPTVTVEREADIPGLIPWHQQRMMMRSGHSCAEEA